jgi:tripeptidyl-peptidase-1
LQGPYVTTVGGTIKVNPEVAANFSGGGFSNYFSRPSYQEGAVSSYLQILGPMNHSLFKCVFIYFVNGDPSLLTDILLSASGRAYPDISAQSMNFQVVVAGKVKNIAGTSCSAPVSIQYSKDYHIVLFTLNAIDRSRRHIPPE